MRIWQLRPGIVREHRGRGASVVRSHYRATDVIMLLTEIRGISLVKLDVFIICATRSNVTAPAFMFGTLNPNVNFCHTLFSYKCYMVDIYVYTVFCMHVLFAAR
jgi:hypothetical protein